MPAAALTQAIAALHSAGVATVPWSPTKRSSRPMATGSILRAITHWLSHWVSCGQTRPHTDGRMFASRITLNAPSMSFTSRWRMNRGMWMATGQPLMQVGRLHCRQRSASRSASDNE